MLAERPASDKLDEVNAKLDGITDKLDELINEIRRGRNERNNKAKL